MRNIIRVSFTLLLISFFGCAHQNNNIESDEYFAGISEGVKYQGTFTGAEVEQGLTNAHAIGDLSGLLVGDGADGFSAANTVALLMSALTDEGAFADDLLGYADDAAVLAGIGAEGDLANSAGLAAALSDETGTGVAVFGTSPTFTTQITIGSDAITTAIAAYLAQINQDLGTGDDVAFNSVTIGATSVSEADAEDLTRAAIVWTDIASATNVVIGSYKNIALTGSTTVTNFYVSDAEPTEDRWIRVKFNGSVAIDFTSSGIEAIYRTDDYTPLAEEQLTFFYDTDDNPVDAQWHCIDAPRAVTTISAAGLIASDGAGGANARTLTGTANQVTVTNGTGSAGNPTLSLPGDLAGIDSIDATGAVDMDYGSVDVTDHTFVSDGGTVVIDGTIDVPDADDPYVSFIPSTASDSSWWIGVNHDSEGDDDDVLEFRQSLTPGTNVRYAINVTGVTKKKWITPKELELDGTNPPTLSDYGTDGQTNISALQFDADGGSTGDDIAYYEWRVPDGYITDSLRLNVEYTFSTAEDAADEAQFDFTVNAVAAGEALDAAGTALADQTTVISDASADNGNRHFTQYNIEVEDIEVDDLVVIQIVVDESASALANSGTLDVTGLELEWESTE